MDVSIESIKRQLQQLKELHESGVLSQTQYDEGRTTLERRLLDQVLQQPPAAPAGDHAQAQAPAAAMASAPAMAAPVDAAPATAVNATSMPAARPSARLWLGVAGVTVVLALAGYAWKGTPQALTGTSAAPAAANGNASHTTDTQQIAAMVEKLAARMKEQPDDVEGWAMLARSYNVLGRVDEAVGAYEKAVALRKDDAVLLSDYADALAVRNNRTLAGEPMKLVERALKIDPNNLKALALAGSYAFGQKDFAGAVRYWEKLVQVGPADNPMVQQMQGAIEEARSLGGMPARAQPLSPSAPAASSAPAGGLASPAAKPAANKAGLSVSGTVSLSAALRAQAQPDDTVFIFARPAEGARMPLAILRKQVKDLPIRFTLDDSLAMSGANPISSAGKVVVGARVSKSGNAMPQPGDLSGQSAVVSVGARDVNVEIREQVKP